MTLRKYRRIGQLVVGAVFAKRTDRRRPFGAPAGGTTCAGAARFAKKDSSGLLVPGDAGATPSEVSMQGHDELESHNAGHCVASSC